MATIKLRFKSINLYLIISQNFNRLVQGIARRFILQDNIHILSFLFIENISTFHGGAA